MDVEEPITLKEVQLRLGVPQHVLIHLCEKGVIAPDFAETSGRGKSRKFSERNVYEFAVALALRRLELPVATTALVVRVLRSFMRAVSRAIPGIELPASVADGSLAMSLFLYDDELIVLHTRGGPLQKPLLLSSKLTPAASRQTQPRVVKIDRLSDQFEVRLEVNLTEIARRTLR